MNSNTCANGFFKGLYKKKDAIADVAQQFTEQSKPTLTNPPNGKSPVRRKLKDMVRCGLDEHEDDSSDADEALFRNTVGAGGPKSGFQGKAEHVALMPFKDLYKESPIIKTAMEFGQAIMPLSAVGMLLNYAGNHLLHYIGQVMHKKVFYPTT